MKHVVYGLVFLFFGAPILLTLIAWSIGVGILAYMTNSVDVDRARFDQAFSNEDLDFGGDESALLKTYRKLRSNAASPADGRVGNRSLSVAVVNVTTDRRYVAKSRILGIGPEVKNIITRPIEINLANATGDAVLLIANRPVIWSAVNAGPAQRAKIAVEGVAVFDLVNAPRGLLAGFKIGAYGAKDATESTDAEGDDLQKRRFCHSLSRWAQHFNISSANIRVWHVTDPQRISLQRTGLEQTGGSISPSTAMNQLCSNHWS